MRDTPTAVAERALVHITDMADENRRLRAELAEAKADAAHWRERHGRMIEIEDGSYASCIGFSGGAHDDGPYAELEVEFNDAEGEHTRRTYRAVDLPKQTD